MNGFLPQHLERIQSAIADLPDTVLESTPSIPTHKALSVDAPPVEAPQGTTEIDTLPLNNSVFKKPKTTPTALLKEEIEKLQRENKLLQEDMKRERQEAEDRADLRQREWM